MKHCPPTAPTAPTISPKGPRALRYNKTKECSITAPVVCTPLPCWQRLHCGLPQDHVGSVLRTTKGGTGASKGLGDSCSGQLHLAGLAGLAQGGQCGRCDRANKVQWNPGLAQHTVATTGHTKFCPPRSQTAKNGPCKGHWAPIGGPNWCYMPPRGLCALPLSTDLGPEFLSFELFGGENLHQQVVMYQSLGEPEFC